jgi:Histidine kinase-, DNA gyrase B-, and HSP90-like ATPase
LPYHTNAVTLNTQPTTTMIVTQSKANVVTQGVQGAVSFGIKQEGLAHIFNVLRNQLYSDKILAVLREYSCNAVDAHTEAGHSRPIEVTLPSRLSLELKIRDYGLGLSETDIQEIYAFYGESTKRKSNSLIGQLGLGSKSAFAYGDNFVINSFYNGIKTTYNAYIDPSQIGQIAKLASASTNEANGVEIVIPVKPADCETFVNTARSLFTFFKVKPMVRGVANFTYEEKPCIYSGADWRIFKADRNSYGRNCVAVMGNIGYTISSSALKLDENNDAEATIERLLSNCDIQLDVPIGEFDIAASREGLQYTDRTIENLKKRILVIRDFLVADITKQLKGAQSLWSFKKMLGEMHNFNSPYYVVCNAMRGKNGYDYNGKAVKDYTINFNNSRGFKLYTPRKGYLNGAYIVKGSKNEDMTHLISLDSGMVIVENTKKIKTQIVNHIFPYLQNDGKVIVFEPINAADRKNQMDALGLSNADVIDMSTLPKVLLPRATRRANNNSLMVNRTKHSSKVFSLDPNSKSLSSYHKVKSDFWVEDDIDLSSLDPKKYCYIEIERFVGMIDGSEIGPVGIMSCGTKLETLAKLAKVKGIVAPNIIGIKKGSTLDKAKKTKLMDFKTFFTNALKEVEAQANVGEVLYADEIHSKFVSANQCLRGELRKLVNANNAPNTHRVLEEVLTLQAQSNDATIKACIESICQNIGVPSKNVRSKRSAKLDAMEVKATKLAHSMRLLQAIDSYNLQTYREGHKEHREACLDYIQTRDHLLAGV